MSCAGSDYFGFQQCLRLWQIRARKAYKYGILALHSFKICIIFVCFLVNFYIRKDSNKCFDDLLCDPILARKTIFSCKTPCFILKMIEAERIMSKNMHWTLEKQSLFFYLLQLQNTL